MKTLNFSEQKMNKGYSNLNENDLVSLYIKNNDSEALNILLYRIEPFVANQVTCMIGKTKFTDDYTQEILIKIVDMIGKGKYALNTNFKSWIYRITRNYVGDRLREMSKFRFYSIDNKIQDFNNINIGNSAEEKIIDHQNLSLLQLLIQKLPTKQKEIIVYRYYMNLSYKDISSLLDISVNTALGRCRYAIINLRKYYSLISD